ncbi:MAG: beta-lactamase family protein [Labilithrix sp.]|nr:beta-lactamase family protein [Labilithrix sp.]
MAAIVHGTCDARFSRVKEAFAETLAGEHELGAACSLVVEGRAVVDLWGGHADRKRTRPWERDTLVNVYSTTKGLLAMCAHRLVQEGRIDLDAPLSTLWPELSTPTTLRWLLSHRSGLPAIRETLPPEALFDFAFMVRALEKEATWWEPGTAHGYHAMTFGWLVGEIVRRVSGKMPRDYFHGTIAGPLGVERDVQIGLALADEGRAADLRPARPAPGVRTLFDRIAAEPESMTAKAFVNPISLVMPDTITSRAWRDADIPSLNGHATARGIARIYGALARGGLLAPESIARCREEQACGPDLVLGVTTRFGLGFMLPQPHDDFGGAASFGHPGAGGSFGFADPDAKLGFGYVMNRMGVEILVDPRPKALSAAAYASL